MSKILETVNEKTEPLSKEYETVIQLLNVYLTERSYRNDRLWKQVYRFFYAILIIMLFPNISSHLGVDILVNTPHVFPVIGIILTCVFFYLSMAYTARFRQVGDTYRKLIAFLPSPYQPEILPKYFTLKLSVVIPLLLSIILWIIGGFLLYYN